MLQWPDLWKGFIKLFSNKPFRIGRCIKRKKGEDVLNASQRRAQILPELSDFDRKYYDLHLKGLIPRKLYEQSRLLDLMYTETNPENEESALQ